jgi:DNA repair protein RecN (Recombination protein N)
MLRHLHVRNFALVEELDIELADGLTVITGESGAGKTILLDALSLVLGERARTDSIRPDAARAEVSAEFDLADNPEALEHLELGGFTADDDSSRCLVRRIVTREGRSRAYINGSSATARQLATLADYLIDIHGQAEQSLLLRRDVQRKLFDGYAGCENLARAVRQAWEDWKTAEQAREALAERIAASTDRLALLEYQVSELDELAVTEGEFEVLDVRFKRLARRDDNLRAVAGALNVLAGEHESGIDDIHRLRTELAGIDDNHPGLAAATELIDGATTYLNEAAGELRHYLEALTSDSEPVDVIEQRIERITELARKHRERPETLYVHHRSLHAELEALDLDASAVEPAQELAAAAAASYRELSGKLSKARTRAVAGYGNEVGAIMQTLGIQGGALAVEFEPSDGPHGRETLDYLVVTNPKFAAGPLSKIASGGERSRISLAIAVVASTKSRLPTLVLDEADVGVGGTTADVVGRLLRQLGQRTQIIAVTHAPQVAALGQHHLCVRKDAAQDTRIEPLGKTARIEELARMLGGREVTDKTKAYAKELVAAGADA